MLTRITTCYLEMTHPSALRPARVPDSEIEVRRAEVASPELNRFLYTAVGGDWYWTDRLVWTYAQWLEYLERPELETWLAWDRGTPAGYAELEMQAEGNVEIAYFGVLPGFIGRGIGGHLLTCSIRRAWEWGARRVWLHTCTLDHPRALPNYLARGFRLYKEETTEKDEPPQPPGPWPGAARPGTSPRSSS
jgi:GNAT superfamily N-acetyltransferase